MGDHDELGILPQLLEQGDEAAEVDVVKCRLDLVEHVERAGARAEDGHQERERGQGLFTAGKQGQALDSLARRAGLDLDASGEHVVRLGEHEARLAAREQGLEHTRKLRLDVRPGVGEQLQDLRVHILDHAGEVLAGLDHVVELRAQKRVALLQCLELLQRQRIDLAQCAQVLLRLLETLLLGVAVEVLARGVVREQVGHRDAQRRGDVGLRLVYAHLRLRARDVGLVRVVRQPRELLAGGAHLLTRLLHLALQGVELRVQLVALGGGAGERVFDAGCQVARMLLDGTGQLPFRPPASHRRFMAGLRLPLLLRLPAKRVALASLGFRTLLRGAGGERCLHLQGLGVVECVSGLVALLRRRLLRRLGDVRVHAGEAVARLLQLAAALGQARVRLVRTRRGALVLGLVHLGLLDQAREVAAPGFDFGVVLAQRRLGGRGAHAGLVGGDGRAFQGAGELLEKLLCLGQFGLRCLDAGGDLHRGGLPRAGGDPAFAHEHACRRDSPQAWILLHHAARGGEIVRHHHVREQARNRTGHGGVKCDVVEQPVHLAVGVQAPRRTAARVHHHGPRGRLQRADRVVGDFTRQCLGVLTERGGKRAV